MHYIIYYGEREYGDEMDNDKSENKIEETIEALLIKEGMQPLSKEHGHASIHESGYEHLSRAQAYILRNIVLTSQLEEKLDEYHLVAKLCEPKQYLG